MTLVKAVRTRTWWSLVRKTTDSDQISRIVKRLEDLGYGKEAQWMRLQQDWEGVGRQFDQLKCVNQPKHLTDRSSSMFILYQSSTSLTNCQCGLT
jgi:hypothetical protein